MSVDVSGYLRGVVKPQHILEFVKCYFDKNAIMEVETKKNCLKTELEFDYFNLDENPFYITTSGFISFYYQGIKRDIWYMCKNINSYGCGESNPKTYYINRGGADLIGNQFSLIQMHSDIHGRMIVRMITEAFGGIYEPYDEAPKMKKYNGYLNIPTDKEFSVVNNNTIEWNSCNYNDNKGTYHLSAQLWIAEDDSDIDSIVIHCIYEDDLTLATDRTLEDNGFIKGIIEYELLQHKNLVEEYKNEKNNNFKDKS